MMPALHTTCLRDVQKSTKPTIVMCYLIFLELLKIMLNFNIAGPVGDDGLDPLQPDNAWKILILDSAGQAILSPILKVNELRESGVTLYLYRLDPYVCLLLTLDRQLHGDRQPIGDVPAIYFVEPTAPNISRIVQDLRNTLYEQVYINFTSSVPRSLLEDLAQQVAQSDSSQLVTKVLHSGKGHIYNMY